MFRRGFLKSLAATASSRAAMRPRVARAALPKMKITRIRAYETPNSFFSVRMRGSGSLWSTSDNPKPISREDIWRRKQAICIRGESFLSWPHLPALQRSPGDQLRQVRSSLVLRYR